MPPSALPIDDETEILALAQVGLGFDTRACRICRERGLLTAPTGTRLDRLLDALNLMPEVRAARRGAAIEGAVAAVEESRRLGLDRLRLGGPGYPEWLGQIADPPLVLWFQGDAAVLNLPSIAIVGSRDASPAGLAAARRLGRDLGRVGLAVVSGLARGVDAAAHEGCLEGGGVTIAVLGSGLNRLYPREHQSLAERIARTGVLITEYPPGTQPLPRHFPLRNRIIAGLARAVVVVEASDKSGSLLTAKAALEQGRDVLAVPGGIASGRHRGCHALIKDGAGLVETVEDILAEVGWQAPAAPERSGPCKRLNEWYLQVLMSGGSPWTLDDLVRESGQPASRVLADLAALELAGLVDRLGGGHFVWIDGPAMDR